MSTARFGYRYHLPVRLVSLLSRFHTIFSYFILLQGHKMRCESVFSRRLARENNISISIPRQQIHVNLIVEAWVQYKCKPRFRTSFYAVVYRVFSFLVSHYFSYASSLLIVCKCIILVTQYSSFMLRLRFQKCESVFSSSRAKKILSRLVCHTFTLLSSQ